jgi:hypothetical protein
MKSERFELGFTQEELGSGPYIFHGELTITFNLVLTDNDEGYIDTFYEEPHDKGPRYHFCIMNDGTVVFSRNLIDFKKPVADKIRERVKELLPKLVI